MSPIGRGEYLTRPLWRVRLFVYFLRSESLIVPSPQDFLLSKVSDCQEQLTPIAQVVGGSFYLWDMSQLKQLSELTAQLAEIVRVNRDEIIALKKKVDELEGALKKHQAFNPYRPIVYK